MLTRLAITNLLLLMCHQFAVASDNAFLAPATRTQVDVLRGSCSNGKEHFNLSELLLLRNASLQVVTEEGYDVIRIDGETVSVDVYRKSKDDPVRTIVHRIDSRVEAQADIDIDVSLAILHSERVIYWRETFKHKSYRQGMFKFGEHGALTPICEGRGGVDSSHWPAAPGKRAVQGSDAIKSGKVTDKQLTRLEGNIRSAYVAAQKLGKGTVTVKGDPKLGTKDAQVSGNRVAMVLQDQALRASNNYALDNKNNEHLLGLPPRFLAKALRFGIELFSNR